MQSRITFTDERRGRAWVLRVMCLALMMVSGAVAGLNVALPSIARDTGASLTQLHWIVDAYAIVFAALLVPAGAVGDRFGRKPLLMAGLALFGAVSFAALFTSSPGTLIALRAGLGVAAALIMPVTLSVVTTVFPPEERGRAVGTWVGVAAGGAVVGMAASGVLLHFFSWPSIFALNVVLAVLALTGTVLVVPATRDARPPRLDPVGTLISVASLLAFVFGLIEGPEHGWSAPLTLATLLGGLAGIALFVVWELRQREPMLDPRNFLRRGFGAGSLSISVQFFAVFGFLFLALPYLQLVLGYTPLRAAGALLPLAAIVIPLSRLAPMIAGRTGIRVTGSIALGLMAAGFLVLSTLGTTSSYTHLLAGLILLGAGMGLAGPPATTAIVASLPRAKQGVASSVNDLSRELGGALGIAVLGSVLNTAYRSGVGPHTAGLPAGLADKARGSVAAAQVIGQRLGAHDLAAQANAAFVHGVSVALLVGTAVLAAGAVFVAFRGPGHAESRATTGGRRAPRRSPRRTPARRRGLPSRAAATVPAGRPTARVTRRERRVPSVPGADRARRAVGRSGRVRAAKPRGAGSA
jgi:EmrB/QacA subfamily drug resistance transporter